MRDLCVGVRYVYKCELNDSGHQMYCYQIIVQNALHVCVCARFGQSKLNADSNVVQNTQVNNTHKIHGYNNQWLEFKHISKDLVAFIRKSN